MPTLDINSDAIVAHTARLERISRSALPVTVRQTLSSAAFDVKQVTMPATSAKFTHRSPTFFKSNSKVAPAKGFDISTMQSTVGFIPSTSGSKEAGGATEDLQEQDTGGNIAHRAFIPLKSARSGGNWNKNVKAALRMAAIKSKIIDSNKSTANNDAGKFYSSAKFAGAGGFVIGNKVSRHGNRLLWLIKSVGGGKFKGVPIYSVKGHRNVHIKPTLFMRKASITSAEKMNKYFIINAERQIAKVR